MSFKKTVTYTMENYGSQYLVIEPRETGEASVSVMRDKDGKQTFIAGWILSKVDCAELANILMGDGK